MPHLSTFVPHDKGKFDFDLFFAKFVGTSLMHLNLHGHFEENIATLKYLTRHWDEFENIFMLFFFSWLQTTFCFVVEWISIIVLFSSPNVKGVLGNFVSLTVLININKLYYDQVVKTNKNNDLANVFNEPLKFKNRKHNEIPDGPSYVTVMKYVYKIYKWIYTCVIFYFVPMAFLVINQFIDFKLYTKAINKVKV